MADVTLKQGDRLPRLARQFLTNNAATDLTGATVTFDMWNAETGTQVILNGACSITNAAQGQVEYAWTSGDAALPAGAYLGAFTATFAGPRELTAPNNGMIVIQITAVTGAEWSYTGNPATRSIDTVRFLIGDTDTENQLVKDAEIEWLLAEANNAVYMAAFNACRSLAMKFAAKADYSRSVGDLSISTQYGAAADRYTKMAAALQQQATDAAPPIPSFNLDAIGDFKFSVDMDKFV